MWFYNFLDEAPEPRTVFEDEVEEAEAEESKEPSFERLLAAAMHAIERWPKAFEAALEGMRRLYDEAPLPGVP